METEMETKKIIIVFMAVVVTVLGITKKMCVANVKSSVVEGNSSQNRPRSQ